MNPFETQLGWLFATLGAFFALGLTPRFSRRFYPGSPGFPRRLAAPVIFAILALACFRGSAIPALLLVIVLGTILIIRSRRNGYRGKGKRPAV